MLEVLQMGVLQKFVSVTFCIGKTWFVALDENYSEWE